MDARSIYWDLVRTFAAVAVVALHAGLNSGVALGVPCFAFLLVRLGKRRDGESFGQLAWRHGRDLLGPWVVWSLLYLVLRALAGSRSAGPDKPTVDGFLIGGYIHLWFLPFAFVTRLVTQGVRLAQLERTPRIGIGLALAAAAALVTLGLPSTLDWARPAPQWLGALPAALLAWSLRTAPAAWPIVLAGLAGFIADFPDIRSGGLVVLAGLLAVDRLQGWVPKSPTPWSQVLADLSWPVYLVHPAVLLAGERLLGMEEPIWRLAFGLCGSAAAGLVILRVPVFKRWLLLRSRS